MGITIKDIAKKAGVSITTVSRIINNKGESFSEETLKKVRDIIDELGYTPNALARGLITKKSGSIGLIIPDITNPFYPDLARGIEDAASELGYNLILCNSDNNLEKERNYISVLKDKYIDGIILTTSKFLNLNDVKLSLGNIPLVILDECVEENDMFGVFVDNVQGGYDAGKYLLELGHRKIACITGPLDTKSAIDRLEGFKKALEESGMELNPELLIEGDYKIEGGAKAAKLLEGKDYTAIFALNDLMAYGVYNTIKASGRRIPEDVSIIGFDDISISKIVEPPLTTIKQPSYKMGVTAAKTLIKLINGANFNNRVILYKPHLVKRGSTMKAEV